MPVRGDLCGCRPTGSCRSDVLDLAGMPDREMHGGRWRQDRSLDHAGEPIDRLVVLETDQLRQGDADCPLADLGIAMVQQACAAMMGDEAADEIGHRPLLQGPVCQAVIARSGILAHLIT